MSTGTGKEVVKESKIVVWMSHEPLETDDEVAACTVSTRRKCGQAECCGLDAIEGLSQDACRRGFCACKAYDLVPQKGK